MGITTSGNNIFPSIASDKWYTENSELKELAVFRKNVKDEYLEISLQNKSYGVGKWIVNTKVEEKHWYEISAIAETKEKVNDIYAIVNVLDKDGELIIREHLENAEPIEQGYSFIHTIEIPENVCSLKLELWIKGYWGNVK